MRALSLDVAAGAAGGGVLAASFLDARVPAAFHIVLPLSVWVVYTADHLLDARRLGPRASTPRHLFHHRHFRTLALATLLGALLAVGIALRSLGPAGVLFGLGMGTFAILHLLAVRLVGDRSSLLLVKELGVALVYAVGIWGLPLIVTARWNDPAAWLAFAQFFLLALTNLLEFSAFELVTDTADGHTSFARAAGRTGALRAARGTLFAALGLGVVGLYHFGPAAFLRLELVYLAMSLLLGALAWRPAAFAHHERHRTWGDGAFLLPWLYRGLPW